MDKNRTCKRCSVLRVNALCDLYERAYNHKDEGAEKTLKILVGLAGERGYGPGAQILRDGLAEEAVRALSWNISSVLTDDDLVRVGIKVPQR